MDGDSMDLLQLKIDQAKNQVNESQESFVELMNKKAQLYEEENCILKEALKRKEEEEKNLIKHITALLNEKECFIDDLKKTKEEKHKLNKSLELIRMLIQTEQIPTMEEQMPLLKIEQEINYNTNHNESPSSIRDSSVIESPSVKRENLEYVEETVKRENLEYVEETVKREESLEETSEDLSTDVSLPTALKKDDVLNKTPISDLTKNQTKNEALLTTKQSDLGQKNCQKTDADRRQRKATYNRRDFESKWKCQFSRSIPDCLVVRRQKDSQRFHIAQHFKFEILKNFPYDGLCPKCDKPHKVNNNQYIYHMANVHKAEVKQLLEQTSLSDDDNRKPLLVEKYFSLF